MAIRALRTGVLVGVVATAVMLVASSSRTHADHITHLAHAYDLGLYGLDGRSTAAMTKWALDSQQANFCIDGNFPSNAFTQFRAAVADWNAAFSVPGGAPLVENCAWQVGFRPGNWPGYPPYPCPGRYACTVPEWSAQRGGYYVAAAHIWLDTTLGWTSAGYRAAAAHELGHVFGLDDQYIHDQPGCNANNPNTVSVLDAFTNAAHCDGTVSPTGPNTDATTDLGRAKDWYTIRPASNPRLILLTGRTIWWDWDDLNYTEANYQEKIQRYSTDFRRWVSYAEKYKTDNVAPCEEFRPCRLADSYTVGQAGYYRVSVIPHNGVFGPRPETRTASVYVP